jgi:hypothetical protein
MTPGFTLGTFTPPGVVIPVPLHVWRRGRATAEQDA